MAKDEAIVKYQARDGQEISLGFETVRAYLVQGKKELVTSQELMFFMGVCRSRGLNPFKKDAYLIKYSQDAAAIVTSIDFFRSRARAQKDCRGWRTGIIVERKDGMEYREGHLLLEGEKLLGGWFEAKPEGWDYPKRHTVSLKPYIKKTREGETTRFWQEDNQPLMIAKVAEAQGLRMLWPDEFSAQYEEGEILADQADISAAMTKDREKAKQEAIEKFKKSIPAPYILEHPSLQDFLVKIARANRCEIDDVMVEAAEKLDEFWAGCREWLKENAGPEVGPPGQNPKTAEKSPAQKNGVSPFSNHGRVDAEIAKKDAETEKKNGEKGKAPPMPAKQMFSCKRKFAGKQVAAIFCSSGSCPDKDCPHAGKKDREPGEDDF